MSHYDIHVGDVIKYPEMVMARTVEPRVVQFLSEVILVISNRTRAAHSFNRAILAQIALHSVQLALFILLCIGFS